MAKSFREKPPFKLFLLFAVLLALPIIIVSANTKTNLKQHASGPNNPCAVPSLAQPIPAPVAYFKGGACGGEYGDNGARGYLYMCNGRGSATSIKHCTVGCTVDNRKSKADYCTVPPPKCPYSCIKSNVCHSANDLKLVSGYTCAAGTVCCKSL